jgi:hypothetical protein
MERDVAYGYNVTGGAKTVTVNLSGSGNASVYVQEISGCLTIKRVRGKRSQQPDEPGHRRRRRHERRG